MRVAAKWYRMAAVQGHTDAQFRLGLMAHYDGRREAAEAWYATAARQGHSDALQHLGCVQRELTQGRRAEVYGRRLEMYEAERAAHSDESDDLAHVERRDAALAANVATRIREPAEDSRNVHDSHAGSAHQGARQKHAREDAQLGIPEHRATQEHH